MLPNPNLQHVLFQSSPPRDSLFIIKQEYTEYAGYRAAESSKTTSEENNVLASLSAMPEKRQSLISNGLQEPHTHLCLRLSYSIILCCCFFLHGDRGWAVKHRLCLGCRLALPLPMPAGQTLPGQLALAMPQWSNRKTHVWCHPITTQAAADSTHMASVSESMP